MPLTINDILKPMLTAAAQSLAQDWGKAEAIAKPEFKNLASSLVDISKLAASGAVNQRQAQAMFNIHKNTTLTVLLMLEGLGVIAVENAINAALKAVAGTVNRAVGFSLI